MSAKFKMCISQLTAKILLKQRSLNQIMTGQDRTYSNLTSFFLIKVVFEYFNDFQN